MDQSVRSRDRNTLDAQVAAAKSRGARPAPVDQAARANLRVRTHPVADVANRFVVIAWACRAQLTLPVIQLQFDRDRICLGQIPGGFAGFFDAITSEDTSQRRWTSGHSKSYSVVTPRACSRAAGFSTLLAALTRSAGSSDRNRFEATAEIVDILSHGRRVIVIDEAQRLNRECIEFLRHVDDHPTTTFALVLVGGDGCWVVLSREPMLRSRIYRRVVFRPLSRRQVLAMLPQCHPLYRGVDDELVHFIDDNFAHGNFRNWAAFTRSAQDLCQRTGRLAVDETIARNVFALHGGMAPAL